MQAVAETIALAQALGFEPPNFDHDRWSRRFGASIAMYGDVASALRLSSQAEHLSLFSSSDSSIDARVLAQVASWERLADVALIAWSQAQYPSWLSDVPDAPPLLFVRGDVSCLSAHGIAIVGTRSASAWGIAEARHAARVLADEGFVIISGLAAGIDAAAHQGALDVKRQTIAVMGTPIDRIYPSANESLASAILEAQGALVTEFLPGRRTVRWDFLRRNKSMSGLARATFVIEAGETSGARSQANAALDHGRPVFLHASMITRFDWARRLVEDGKDGARAIAVESVEDVVAALVATPSELADPLAF